MNRDASILLPFRYFRFERRARVTDATCPRPPAVTIPRPTKGGAR